jgi:hypothetical protein
MNPVLARGQSRYEVIGVGSLLARSTSSSVRQAQDDPERSRMGQGPEPVEGQAILTSESRASSPPTIGTETAKPPESPGVNRLPPALRSCADPIWR